MEFQLNKNADCPCGSGRKYKLCCSGKLSNEQEKYYRLLYKEGIIKNKLVKWAESYFSNDELDNYAYKFNKKNLIDLDSKIQITRFFDWLFLEAMYKDEEKRIIEIIIEHHSQVFQPDELAILEEWRDNTQSGIYEIIETNPEEWTMKIKEVFTGKESVVTDRKASLGVVKGDIIFGRLQKIFSHYYLSGVAQTYPRLYVFEQLKNFINNHFENERKKNPNMDYEEFMNRNSKILNDFSPEDIKIVSHDNKEFEMSEARYSINLENIDYILNFFDENPDKFIITDVDFKNKQFKSANIAYLGDVKQNNKKIEKTKEISQKISSYLINEDGKRILINGRIDIQKNQLKINSFSKRFYKEIKDLLDTNLGDYIYFIKEDIQSASEIIEELKNKELNDEDVEPVPPKFKELGKKFLENYYKEWCDLKIPMLGNKTPREAIKTEEGVKLINDLLLDFENQELHKKRDGLDYVLVEKIIRKELNFY